MVEEILKDKKKREETLRSVLHSPAVPPKMIRGAIGKFQVLRNWASYTSVDLMRPLNKKSGPGIRRTGGGYFLWWNGWGLVIDPGLGFGEAFRAAGWLPETHLCCHRYAPPYRPYG